MQTACGSLHLAREEYKSLMSEGYKELKRTCPLCTTLYMKKLNICIENIYYMIYNISKDDI